MVARFCILWVSLLAPAAVRLPQGMESQAALVKQSSIIRPWSDAVFAEAKRDHRFVLLDLEAVWCHWCHVMDANTYGDPQVIRLLQAHYITVKVDQDSRPDLSNRYEEYGCPATVIFDGGGHEIVKRQGYLAPDAGALRFQTHTGEQSRVSKI